MTPSHPARPRSTRTGTLPGPRRHTAAHARMRSGTSRNPGSQRVLACRWSDPVRTRIRLAGNVMRELALVVQAHAERELPVRPEHQRLGAELRRDGAQNAV